MSLQRSIPLHGMIDWIDDFLSQKALSENTILSYGYDLQGFCTFVGERVTDHRLRLYQESLSALKTSAKKRKISVVNQFLYYLYDTRKLERFYKLTVTETVPKKQVTTALLDLAMCYQETEQTTGQLIALLMLELGLLPSEMMTLRVEQIDRDFEIVTIKRGQAVRILPLPKSLLPYLHWEPGQVYLFDKKGHPYSRQWFFNQLTAYLNELGLENLTAQKLREQYILREIARGTTLFALAKQLGLSTPTTLEMYYNGY